MTATLGKIIADFNTTLNLKVAIGATSATIDSATDDDGVALPTGTYFLTIDGDSVSSKEYIKCTLTSTALTSIQSVSRQGALTSGFARTHRKGATVTITDFAIIRKMLDLLDGTTDFNASVPLKYDGTATISNANEFATKAYVDGVAIAGGADASTTVKGITKMSVAPASAASPIAVGDNDPRVPTTDENDALVGTSGTPSSSNKYVTNDDTSATSSASKIYRQTAGGKIDATMLEGALPALNGASLTNVNAVDPLSITSAVTTTYWTQQIPIIVTSTSTAIGWTYSGAGGNALAMLNATTIDIAGTTSSVLSSPIYGGGAGNSTYQYNSTKILRIKARVAFLQGGSNIWGFGLVITPANIYTAHTDTTAGEIRFVNNAGTLYAQNANGTATHTDVTGSLTLSDLNLYEIVFTPATSILYYINGTLVATHTTNLPNNASNALLTWGASGNGRNVYTQYPVISVQL